MTTQFAEKMQQAIMHSYHKYGNAYKTYPILAQAYKCAQERLDLYLRSRNPKQHHNTEMMVDVANFCMLEWMFPAFGSERCINSGTGWRLDWSDAFVKRMKEYAESKTPPPAGTYLDHIDRSLKDYRSIGKADFDARELLVQAAAYAFMEYSRPSYEDATYSGTSDADSPGLADGISYKEMMEQAEAENGGRYGW